MKRIQASSLIVLSTLVLTLSVVRAPAHAESVAKVETGRVANGDYAQRREVVGEQVRPKEGYQTKLVLGDIVARMVSHGVIDVAKIEALYKERGGVPAELQQLLTQASDAPLLVTKENADWLVNVLWPLGLSNRMAVNKRSPIAGRELASFASTGGWELGKEKNGAGYFNRYQLIPLTRGQERRV